MNVDQILAGLLLLCTELYESRKFQADPTTECLTNCYRALVPEIFNLERIKRDGELK